MDGGHIMLDADKWPIVVVTPVDGSEGFSEEVVEGFLADYADKLGSAAQPYATILDLRRCKDLSPAHRRRITSAMQKNENDRATQAGFAMVFESRGMQMLLTAILWVVKPPYPWKVFTSVGEALLWVEERLAQSENSDGIAV